MTKKKKKIKKQSSVMMLCYKVLSRNRKNQNYASNWGRVEGLWYLRKVKSSHLIEHPEYILWRTFSHLIIFFPSFQKSSEKWTISEKKRKVGKFWEHTRRLYIWQSWSLRIELSCTLNTFSGERSPLLLNFSQVSKKVAKSEKVAKSRGILRKIRWMYIWQSEVFVFIY